MSTPTPFDPSVFRRSQDFAAASPTKRILAKIPVCKPAKEWFIRTHPNPAYWYPTQVIELRDQEEMYLVANDLVASLEGESTLRSKLLVTSISRQGTLFLWPINLPNPGDSRNGWNESARNAADQAKTQWLRFTSNRDLAAYEVTVAVAQFPDPDFPDDLPFEEMLSLAFAGKIITGLDHTVLRRLRGEI